MSNDERGGHRVLEIDVVVWRGMTSKQRRLFQFLDNVFICESIRSRIMEMLEGMSTGRISGRLLYWMTTNFSKSQGLYIVTDALTTNVWESYNARLKEWNRHSFDPFCRRGAPALEFCGHVTSLAQLHFLYWAVATGVAEFTRENAERITKHQEQAMRRVKERKKGGNSKRTQISPVRIHGAVGFNQTHDPRIF